MPKDFVLQLRFGGAFFVVVAVDLVGGDDVAPFVDGEASCLQAVRPDGGRGPFLHVLDDGVRQPSPEVGDGRAQFVVVVGHDLEPVKSHGYRSSRLTVCITVTGICTFSMCTPLLMSSCRSSFVSYALRSVPDVAAGVAGLISFSI